MDLNLKHAKALVAKLPTDLRTHSYNVCSIAVTIAKYSGLSADQMRDLQIGALIHDIGKTQVAGDLLNKPGRLTKEEYHLVKQHTVLGANMIRGYQNSDRFREIILYHHEHWNGNGYFGLAEFQIPKLARIVTIADAFDAMTSYRAYQRPKNLTDALRELNNNKGTQFDPKFVKLLEDYLMNVLKGNGQNLDSIGV
jgi:putative nucleotidyltransferase with HDIG domain